MGDGGEDILLFGDGEDRLEETVVGILRHRLGEVDVVLPVSRRGETKDADSEVTGTLIVLVDELLEFEDLAKGLSSGQCCGSGSALISVGWIRIL